MFIIGTENMKKLVLALAASAMLSSVSSAQTAVSYGDIELSGYVTSAACSLSIDKVNLQSPTVNELKGINAAGPWGTGSIKFNKCELKVPGGAADETYTSVSVEIEGGSQAGSSNLWMNQGTAQNVGVEVRIDGKVLDPAKGLIGADAITKNLAGEDGPRIKVEGRTKKFSADDATAGTVNTTIPIVARYK